MRKTDKNIKYLYGIASILFLVFVFISWRVFVRPSTKQNPEEVNALVALGWQNYPIGKYDEAQKLFEQAINLAPDNPAGYMGLGNILRYRGNFEDSEKAYKKVLSLTPDDVQPYIELGKLYRAWHKWDEAEKSLLKAAKMKPDYDQIYSYGLGYLYRDEGRMQEALAMFKKAWGINPNEYNYM